jgi:TonB family protein
MAHQTISRIESSYAVRPTDVPVDLAVDLTLDEIVQQARLATTATGAAIVLAVGSEMICRAKTGATAGDVVTYLNTRSGMLDACLRTGEAQRCDDAESDPRVQALACRSFGARSILVVPVKNGKGLAGVMEIFSPRPHDFSDRDVRTLQALSQRIAANVNVEPVKTALTAKVMHVCSGQSDLVQVVTVQASPSTKTMTTNPPTDQPGPVVPASRSRLEVRYAVTSTINRTLLTTVIGLALLVGWMIGRAGKERSLPAHQADPRISAALAPAAKLRHPASNGVAVGEQVVNETASVPVTPPDAGDPRSNSNAPGSQIVSASARAAAPQLLSKDKSTTAAVSSSDRGALEDRKPVRSDESPAVRTTRNAGAAAKGTSLPLMIDEDVATANVLQRIEPEYPRKARDQRIQGSVVLDVVVGKDGSVEQLIPVTGDSELAPAAAAAVRQWRFKPLDRNGKAIEFESHVTLNFTLP